MKNFEWHDDLDTGIELIDDQHKQYGRFANAFFKLCYNDRDPRPELRKAFDFLHAYAREHLTTEEALMEEYDYPQRAAHLERHDYLRKWIDDTHERLKETKQLSGDFLMKINYVLVEWFQEHIRGMDHRLTRYLRQVAAERNDSKLLRMIKGIFSVGDDVRKK
ncbi:MAG: bacteriohemerythrin [Kiritimatiellaeota bacterium]|nr:bacteriohemerythrin [Kiritimatiellota bacterium]